MKKAIITLLAGMSFATAAWACTTNTYFINGKMVVCTTCCFGNNCTTNCF
jgi:hypothetical protein